MIRGSNNRRIIVGIGSMMAGAALLVGSLPGGAGAAPTGDVPITSSTVVDDNPTCADLAPDGETWTEFKYEPVEDGTDGDGILEVTVTVTENEETGPTFNWSSNIGVDAVFVKGGPDGLLYTYDPEATSDSGLHAPVNPENDKFYGLSHVKFCYDEDDEETTTTTEDDGTTTTEKDKDTTTTSEKDEETTTTVEGETTTTVEGETTSTTAAGGVTTTTVSDGELPRTGNNTAPMLGLGAALLAGGTALIAGTRRLRNSQN